MSNAMELVVHVVGVQGIGDERGITRQTLARGVRMVIARTAHGVVRYVRAVVQASELDFLLAVATVLHLELE